MAKPTRPKRGRPPKDRTAVRQRILEGADTVFHTHGMQSTSVRDVAGSVGLSYGSLYNYFDGRRGLIGAYARARFEAPEDQHDASLQECLTDILRRLIELPYFGADEDATNGVDAAIYDVVTIAVLDRIAARIRPLLHSHREDEEVDTPATAMLISLATIGAAHQLIGRSPDLPTIVGAAKTIAMLAPGTAIGPTLSHDEKI